MCSPLPSISPFFSPHPLTFRPLLLILNSYPASLTHSWSTSNYLYPIQPITYHFNTYLVPVFDVSTCFTYLRAYMPSYFTCPYAYVIHFYALCCLCLYTLCDFLWVIRQDYLFTLRFLKHIRNASVVFLVPIFLPWFSSR